MTVAEFIAKWKRSDLKERSAAQEHFIDLCRLVGHPTPAEVDPTGATFCFETFPMPRPADLTDDQVLEQLLDLNVTRSETGDIGGPREG